MEEKWVISAKKADFKKNAEIFGIDQVTARLIRNRDIIGDEQIQKYLYGDMSMLSDWHLLKDIDRAVHILNKKITEGKQLRIIGDYDIDGVMSSYILLKGFERLGARVDVVIPDRIRDGYGLNENLIEDAVKDKIDTIITCDNGISAYRQIELAKNAGITVIVTDHHEVPFLVKEDAAREEIIPPADAVINPKQTDCSYPFKGICGAVVASQLIAALYAKYGVPGKEMEDFLVFEAIATIGDVMDLKDDNRIIVKEGLRRLPYVDNKGLQALLKVTGIDGNHVTPYHIGYVIGPCLNAGGRLDTAKRSLELLCCEKEDVAYEQASELKALNEERKQMTEDGLQDAINQIESTPLHRDSVLVVFLPETHESIAGIIAGRLRERYHKPSIVLTKSKEGIKGSGRSIEAYSMFEKLTEVGELLDKFGGHPMAAGLSLQENRLDEFRQRLNERCELTREDLTEKVVIDVPMPIGYVSMQLVSEFSILEPFGKGNRKPLFAQKGIHVKDCRILGAGRNVVKMKLVDPGGASAEGIYFGDADSFLRDVKEKGNIDIVYYPEINRFRDRENLQIVIQKYR